MVVRTGEVAWAPRWAGAAVSKAKEEVGTVAVVEEG